MTDTRNSEPQTEPQDVTGVFDHYRVSARAIWNTAFWPDPDFHHWDAVRDHPVNTIKRGQAELQFIEYFDWDRMAYIDLRYYRVQIGKFDEHPDLVGREALIDCQNAGVYLKGE